MSFPGLFNKHKIKSSNFPKDLVYKDISIQEKTFTIVLMEDFIYYDSKLGVYKVPKGFDCDLASIPQGFQWLFPKVGIYNAAAVLHDYGYCVQRYPRHEIDELFLRAMEDCGVSYIRRYTIYNAVRMFGWIRWNAVKEKELIKYRNLK